MNRLRTAFVVASLMATVFVRPGLAEVNITIGVPPPPNVVFQTEPEVVVVPRTRVYYVPTATDYDMYHFGPYWYVNRGGYWYRARGYRGPFKVVEYRQVPHEIVVVPTEYRHHPPHPPKPVKHFNRGRFHGRDKHRD